MSLLAIGINHHTASVDLREKVAFGPDKLANALQQLSQHEAVNGSVILSTCNRTEVYCDVKSGARSKVIDWLSQFHQIGLEELKPSLYVYEEQAAIRHLMRVSCGLDSLVLGEPQILGQVKQAYSDSREQQAVDASLEKLFQKTFSVAKRVRTETDKLVAKHLHANGCSKMIVANRTRERALTLAEQFDAQVISLQEIPNHLAKADIVISSTANIAVPRDVEAQVGELNDAYLYTVDDLQSIIDSNIEQRKVEAIQAEAIVAEESAAFMSWLRSLQAVDSIREYRQSANEIREDLLSKALLSLESGSDPEKVLRELSNRLTNKLIHAPTRALQLAAEQGEPAKLTVIRQSLGLDELK